MAPDSSEKPVKGQLGSVEVRSGVSGARQASRAVTRGRTAVWQARLVLLVMINIAQLWILSATIEAALAAHYKQLVPLVIASGVCWLIALSIFLWWKPAERRPNSFGRFGR
jgi:hypothetical protein